MELAGKRIFLGLSGGVDSAVSGALLKKAGADIVGVFLKGWYPPGLPCTWAAERRDAMRVAARLQIPFLTLDAEAEYKKGVIDYLLHEYRAGKTPNPDVMCNRDVKFGVFYTYALSQGADAIATGHYARVMHGEEGGIRRGKDEDKDQSYFLWAVPKSVLAQIEFPVGNLHKEEVRRLAWEFRLPVAKKKDSQGICFLGSISVSEFLRNEFGVAPGKAKDEAGVEVGRHDGVLLSTLGERVRLKDGPPGPWYVLSKDIEKNEITVGRSRLLRAKTPQKILFSNANWHHDSKEVGQAQTRYHGPVLRGEVRGNAFLPASLMPEPAAPGQSIVFYNGERLIGGGIIEA